MVSRESFENSTPSLNSYLLTACYAAKEEDDAFDAALRGVMKDSPPLRLPWSAAPDSSDNGPSS